MILIVDDDPELMDLLGDVVDEENIETRCVADGHDALKILETQSADIIFSDYKMPTMSGIELLSKVRARGIVTPLVMITGYPDFKMVLRALRLGATDVITKPFDVDELKSIMFRALAISRAQQNVSQKIAGLSVDQKVIKEINADLAKIAKLQAVNDEIRT